ncbi:hypothetical protein [Candidatus Methanoprimaticola sp. MG2]|uniref:hypothetical protein n=1 Tax=Candidatus Methanoprimaticola sp. MG2 TaxID=3228838 RepID=UPI0039C6A930
MLPLVVGALSAIGSVVYLYLDWNTSQDIADSVSQMEYYVNLLNGQMSLTEFIEGAWPSMVVIGLILLAGYIIATPQRKGGRT